MSAKLYGDLVHTGDVVVKAQDNFVVIAIPCSDRYEAVVKTEQLEEALMRGEFLLIRRGDEEQDGV